MIGSSNCFSRATIMWIALHLFMSVISTHAMAKSLTTDNNHQHFHHSPAHHMAQMQQHPDQHQFSNCGSIRQILNGTSIMPPSLDDNHGSSNSFQVGSVCGGQCCGDSVEAELTRKSTSSFRQTMRHHTNSLRISLQDTAKVFREHVIQLSHQSENKTLNIFAQVYHRMAPFSRKPIVELYDSVRSHISPESQTDNLNMENVVRSFFMNLFPVAYHHVLHAESQDQGANGDFHVDYKRCLLHTFDDIQPFGDIPKNLAHSLQQSVGAATTFVRALDRGAAVLASVENLDESHFGAKCTSHLLKLNYCQDCNNHSGHQRKVKTCYGYCLNVMRGCLTQYVDSLDQPWTGFAHSIEQLLHMVRSKDGIESVIRSLEGKLSEAIMHAMQNGPELEQKVRKMCGTPSMLPPMDQQGGTGMAAVEDGASNATSTGASNRSSLGLSQKKWITPPDTEMLQFLVTIDHSENFYAKIVNSYCEDNEFQRDDKSCWMGDRVGEYAQPIQATGVMSQKYNPEVPYNRDDFQPNAQVNELVDKLISLRQSVSNAIGPHNGQNSYGGGGDHMQSDMAEGSAEVDDPYLDDSDFAEGSGSGHGPVTRILPEPPIDKATTITPVGGAKTSGSSVQRISNGGSILAIFTVSVLTTVYLA